MTGNKVGDAMRFTGLVFTALAVECSSDRRTSSDHRTSSCESLPRMGLGGSGHLGENELFLRF